MRSRPWTQHSMLVSKTPERTPGVRAEAPQPAAVLAACFARRAPTALQRATERRAAFDATRASRTVTAANSPAARFRSSTRSSTAGRAVEVALRRRTRLRVARRALARFSAISASSCAGPFASAPRSGCCTRSRPRTLGTTSRRFGGAIQAGSTAFESRWTFAGTSRRWRPRARPRRARRASGASHGRCDRRCRTSGA